MGSNEHGIGKMIDKMIDLAVLQTRIERASRHGIDQKTFVSLVTDVARHAGLSEAYVSRMADFATEAYGAGAE